VTPLREREKRIVMGRSKVAFLLAGALVLSMLAACGGRWEPAGSTVEQLQGGRATEAAMASPAATAVTEKGAERQRAGVKATAATAENSQSNADSRAKPAATEAA
jgi:hypothetical protein